MTYIGGGAAAGGQYYAAMAQALKASGTIVKVGTEDFLKILKKSKDPLVVTAKGGVFKANYQYLTGYKGLAFFTKSDTPLMLPSGSEVVASKEIWMPG
jgi:hypothetical protein